MKEQNENLEKQLSLFPLINRVENKEIKSENNHFLSNIGKTQIDYIDSKSLLTSPRGFIGLYKFTLNPYSGCSFGCDYCYARFFAPSKEQQENWGYWVKVKENAIDLINKAIRSRSKERRLETGDTVYLSSVTDPYQPIENKIKLTRNILEKLIEIQPRLTIQTRSPIVLRDLDLFKEFKNIRINITITTDSEEVKQRYEPDCPSIKVRLNTAKKIAESGIPLGISISPMLPIKNPEKFGETIAELEANEYVTQFFKPTRSRFSAGTSASSLEKMKEDNWTKTDYNRVRTIVGDILGKKYPLLEGNQGYAPA